MKQFFWCLLALSCVTISCKESFKPLPRKELENLLTDLNLAETYSAQVKDSVRRAPGKNIDSLHYYYQVILKHYHLTEDQLAANLEWCKTHSDELDSVCTHLITHTTILQNRIK